MPIPRMTFPFGRIPLFLLAVALAAGAGVALTHLRYGRERPDLIFMTHARLHADVYRTKLPEFERRHGVKVELQELPEVTLRSRLLAAFAAGTDVPDVVEIPQNPAVFIQGPPEDCGFLDLTDWVRELRLDERMLASRFSIWQRRGHILALPHDVHPTMLAYRADIVEGELGIDVAKLATWDDFVAVARTIVRDTDGDGNPDRFALELPGEGGEILVLLMLQRGVGLFDAEGRVTFDDEAAVDVIIWYLRQFAGPQRIGYSLGFGQAVWQGMRDGLVLFHFVPDWRTRQIEEWAPDLAGKVKLMPLPAWAPGGIRTSTWGATGIAATKGSRRPELAKKLIEFLYVEQTDRGRAAEELHILPPVKEVWASPLLNEPSRFFAGQPIMRLYADLAPQVPPNYSSPFTPTAQGKRNQAFVNCVAYYRRHGEDGLREHVRAELRRAADTVRAVIARAVITEQ